MLDSTRIQAPRGGEGKNPFPVQFSPRGRAGSTVAPPAALFQLEVLALHSFHLLSVSMCSNRHDK